MLPQLLSSASFRLFKQRSSSTHTKWVHTNRSSIHTKWDTGQKHTRYFLWLLQFFFSGYTSCLFQSSSLQKTLTYIFSNQGVYNNMIYIWKASQSTHLLNLTCIFVIALSCLPWTVRLYGGRQIKNFWC